MPDAPATMEVFEGNAGATETAPAPATKVLPSETFGAPEEMPESRPRMPSRPILRTQPPPPPAAPPGPTDIEGEPVEEPQPPPAEPEEPLPEEGGEEKPPEPPKPEQDDSETIVEYKVDGQLVQQPLREVTRLASKAAAADRRFQEAANMRKEFNASLEYLKRNPMEALIGLFAGELGGLDDPQAQERAREYVDALADRWVAQKFEEAQLPPHERKIRQLQKELQQTREHFQRIQALEKEKEISARAESMRQRRHAILRQAIKQEGLNERDGNFLQLVDQKLWEAYQQGFEMSPADAIREVVDERNRVWREQFSGASPDEILKLRPDLAEWVRKRSLEAVRGPQAGTATQPPERIQPAKRVYRTFAEIQEEIRKAGG